MATKEMNDRAELLDSRPIHDGRVVKLGIETVLLPNGKTTELEIIRHQGAAAVVPVDASGNVLLVRQYRHAVGGWLLEIPAGKLDPGETPEQCALRETEEEVGVKAGRLEPLGPIWTTPGFTDEQIWLFLATELEPGAQALEDDEPLMIEKMSLSDAIALIDNGEISDSKSIVALLKAERILMG
jgi:ADP-ribose pyrophosphatase